MSQLLDKQEYLNFINSLHSDVTVKIYSLCLKNYMLYLKINDVSLLVNPETKKIEQQIISYLVDMRRRGLGYSAQNLRLGAVKKFYEMNDIVLNWKKISQYLGEKTRVNKDR